MASSVVSFWIYPQLQENSSKGTLSPMFEVQTLGRFRDDSPESYPDQGWPFRKRHKNKKIYISVASRRLSENIGRSGRYYIADRRCYRLVIPMVEGRGKKKKEERRMAVKRSESKTQICREGKKRKKERKR